MNETMVVECPHCDERFETHTFGDVCACESCGKRFRRFVNEIMTDTEGN